MSAAEEDYADEEVPSKYTYPKEYLGPKPIMQQILKISKIFDIHSLNASQYVESLPQIPKEAEGWFAIPTVNAIAKKHFPYIDDENEKYCRAVRLVHEYIKKSRRFDNYEEKNINPTHLECSTRTKQALQILTNIQKNDFFDDELNIMIIAAQLGLRHRGRSVRRVSKLIKQNEFGLDSLAIGSIILCHPERFTCWEELDIDCAGDYFSPDNDDKFSAVPCFCFRLHSLEYCTGPNSYVDMSFGSATAFIVK